MQRIEAIEVLPAFRKWCGAFRSLTGVDIHLVDGLALESSLRRAAGTVGLCERLCGGTANCEGCRRGFMERLRRSDGGSMGPFALRCFAGMTVTACGFRLADGSVAFLRTNPVVLRLKRRLEPAVVIGRRLTAAGVRLAPRELRRLAAEIPVCERERFNAAAVVLGLIAAQLAHLSRAMPGDVGHDGGEDVAVRRCREIIERRFTEDLHVDHLAHELRLSRSHLSHLFVRCLGVSFTDYLSALRVAEMRRLLADSRHGVTEVMFAAGFQSVSQANRVFRAATGMSPRDYRLRISGEGGMLKS
jgi:AraC-like DNA-binding protein